MPPSPSPRQSGDRRGRSAIREGSVQTEPPSRQASSKRASPGSNAGSSKRHASPKSGGSSRQRASKQRASPSSASKQQALQLQEHPPNPPDPGYRHPLLIFGNRPTGRVLPSLRYFCWDVCWEPSAWNRLRKSWMRPYTMPQPTGWRLETA